MTAEKQVEFQMVLDYSDQTNFVSFCTLEKKPYQKLLIIAIAIIGAAMYLLKDKGIGWFNVAGFAAIVAMLLLLSRRRKKVSGDDTPWMVLKCPLEVILSEEGILERPVEGTPQEVDAEPIPERFNSWSQITEAFENSRYFYVFCQAHEAFILPKERMDKETVNSVSQLLKDKLGDRLH